MNLAITIAGIVGLAVAAFFFVDLCVDAVRHRRSLDIVVAVVVVAAVVWLLVAYGGALLQ